MHLCLSGGPILWPMSGMSSRPGRPWAHKSHWKQFNSCQQSDNFFYRIETSLRFCLIKQKSKYPFLSKNSEKNAACV